MTPSSWQWLTTSTIFLKICAACKHTTPHTRMPFSRCTRQPQHVHHTNGQQQQQLEACHIMLPSVVCAGLAQSLIHLALSEVLGLNDVVKQLAALAQLHDNVDVVLVLMGALQEASTRQHTAQHAP